MYASILSMLHWMYSAVKIQAVVLDSRKQRLALTAKIMDCCHYSPDTPMEGRWDREGRTTRGTLHLLWVNYDWVTDSLRQEPRMRDSFDEHRGVRRCDDRRRFASMRS